MEPGAAVLRPSVFSCLRGTEKVRSGNGAKRETAYDFANRVSEQKVHARSGKILVSKKGYEGNELLYDEDPHVRRAADDATTLQQRLKFLFDGSAEKGSGYSLLLPAAEPDTAGVANHGVQGSGCLRRSVARRGECDVFQPGCGEPIFGLIGGLLRLGGQWYFTTTHNDQRASNALWIDPGSSFSSE